MPASPEFGSASPSSQITPPAPGQHIIAWAMENPTAIAQLVDLHNKLQNLEITVVQDGVTKRFPVMMPTRGGNAMIELQL